MGVFLSLKVSVNSESESNNPQKSWVLTFAQGRIILISGFWPSTRRLEGICIEHILAKFQDPLSKAPCFSISLRFQWL